jgi:hypothetical protein
MVRCLGAAEERGGQACPPYWIFQKIKIENGGKCTPNSVCSGAISKNNLKLLKRKHVSILSACSTHPHWNNSWGSACFCGELLETHGHGVHQTTQKRIGLDERKCLYTGSFEVEFTQRVITASWNSTAPSNLDDWGLPWFSSVRPGIWAW